MSRSKQVKGVADRIVFLNPGELKPHPVNRELYDEREDPSFVDSVRYLGVREPLIVDSNRVILGGHRRWRAALTLALSKVPCVVQEFDNEQVAIVELNHQRVKTPRERYREAQVLRRELEPKARKKQGARTDLLSVLTKSSINSTHVRDEIARRLAVSSGQLYKIEFIYEHENLAPGVAEKLDQGNITVHKAYQEIKRRLRSTAPQVRSEPEKKPLKKNPLETPPNPLTIEGSRKIILDKQSRTLQIEFSLKEPVDVTLQTVCVVGEKPSNRSTRKHGHTSQSGAHPKT